ncbi:hypothetical protein [Brevundimonas lutea]|uniref:hypothetical protein n=1 Tax=Brevundimonas lutea TaxID=2293980 RepID=UPI000F03B70C|nr:hypothetical protein [Brevundimonas lutea]
MSATDRTLKSLGLPEAQWLWRRLIVWTISLGLTALLARVVERAPAAAAVPIAEGLMKLLGLVLILYLVAPSAQQLVELITAARLRLGGGPR